MNSWIARAYQTQGRVRADEAGKVQEYGDEEARQATVHSREDIVLLVSLLDTANSQLNAIRWRLELLVLMGGVGVWMGLKALHYL
jgi:hypothetical protein